MVAVDPESIAFMVLPVVWDENDTCFLELLSLLLCSSMTLQNMDDVKKEEDDMADDAGGGVSSFLEYDNLREEGARCTGGGVGVDGEAGVRWCCWLVMRGGGGGRERED